MTTQLPHSGVTARFLSLNEYFDEYGRLIQILGNAAAPFGSPYEGTRHVPRLSAVRQPDVGATEESVHYGDTEVWEIYNTTGDVHPMHFHLVNVQVINRQLFDVTAHSPTSLHADPSSRPSRTSWGGRRRCRCIRARSPGSS